MTYSQFDNKAAQKQQDLLWDVQSCNKAIQMWIQQQVQGSTHMLQCFQTYSKVPQLLWSWCLEQIGGQQQSWEVSVMQTTERKNFPWTVHCELCCVQCVPSCWWCEPYQLESYVQFDEDKITDVCVAGEGCTRFKFDLAYRIMLWQCVEFKEHTPVAFTWLYIDNWNSAETNVFFIISSSINYFIDYLINGLVYKM